MSIFSAPAALPQTRVVNGISMVDVPGGVFAMGSQRLHDSFGNSQPHMVRVAPFAAAVMPVTGDQYREAVKYTPATPAWLTKQCDTLRSIKEVTEGEIREFVAEEMRKLSLRRPDGNPRAPGTHPVTFVSVADCQAYLDACNHGKPPAEQIRFLTEAEFEFLARGPAIDVRQLMQNEGLKTAASLAEYLRRNDNYLENFVSALELGATIVANAESPEFAALIDGGSPVFAWRAWGTDSGLANKTTAWYDESGTTPVSSSERLNGYGVSDMAGNAKTWVADGYRPDYQQLSPENPHGKPRHQYDKIVIKGGGWGDVYERYLLAAYRDSETPLLRSGDVGLRVGAPPQGGV